MLHGRLFAVLAIFAAGSQPEPDFYLHFPTCSTVAGFLRSDQDSLRTVTGTGYLLACSRISARASCAITFADKSAGAKGSTVDYSIDIDAPPLLSLRDATYADYYFINIVEHKAVAITRVLTENAAGAKVCTGDYFTAMEMKTLRQ